MSLIWQFMKGSKYVLVKGQQDQNLRLIEDSSWLDVFLSDQIW